jgi:hypothetical protein
VKYIKIVGRSAFWTLQALALAVFIYVVANMFLLLSVFAMEIELDEADRDADCVVEQVITDEGSRFCMVCYLADTRFVPFCY